MKLIKDTPVVVTPEIELANLIDVDGTPVITHWYEPSADFYSEDTLTARNRAEIEYWQRQTLTGAVHTFSNVGDANVVTNKVSYMDTDINFTEYTVFAVAAISQGFADATGVLNTALFGTAAGDEGLNAPYLAYSNGGNWRVFGAPSGGDEQVRSAMSKTEAQNLHLFTLSHSSDGVKLRIDGVEVASKKDGSAVAPITAKKCRLMGFNFSTGAFDGRVGNIIFCKRDLNKDLFSLDKIESFLMSKYNLTP